MKLSPEIRAGIFTYKGERHYTWPVTYLENGLRARCRDCLYYLEYRKATQYFDGECTSVMQNTRRGYVHRKDGKNDLVEGNDVCRLFFWKEETGEQIKLEQKGEKK